MGVSYVGSVMNACDSRVIPPPQTSLFGPYPANIRRYTRKENSMKQDLGLEVCDFQAAPLLWSRRLIYQKISVALLSPHFSRHQYPSAPPHPSLPLAQHPASSISPSHFTGRLITH